MCVLPSLRLIEWRRYTPTAHRCACTTRDRKEGWPALHGTSAAPGAVLSPSWLTTKPVSAARSTPYCGSGLDVGGGEDPVRKSRAASWDRARIASLTGHAVPRARQFLAQPPRPLRSTFVFVNSAMEG